MPQIFDEDTAVTILTEYLSIFAERSFEAAKNHCAFYPVLTNLFKSPLVTIDTSALLAPFRCR